MVLQDCGGAPLLVTASYQVSHSQPKRATWLEMRSCPLPCRAGLHSRTPQCEGMYKGLVASLQTGTTWRTIPALELTSLRPRCWPGPVTCSSACSCFLHSPLSLIPRPPRNNLMPANLHFITSFPGNLACLCH